MRKKMKLRITAFIVFLVLMCNTWQIVYAEKVDKNNEAIYLDDHTFYYEVPQNFDPIKATDQELANYGIQKRPTDPVEKSKWEKKMTGLKWVKPVIGQVPNNIKIGGDNLFKKNDSINNSNITFSAVQSNNWCGYLYYSTSYGVTGEVIVPYAYAPTNYQPAACAQWVGIGGGSRGKLAQNGVFEFVTSSGVSYYAFYETIGTNVGGESHTLGFPISPGDDVYFSTTVSSASSGINLIYSFQDFTKSTFTSVTVNVTDYTGITDTAEWIFERPAYGSQLYYNLARPTVDSSNVVNFVVCKYQSSLNGAFTAATSGTQADIYNGSTALATSSSLSSGKFSVTWKNYN